MVLTYVEEGDELTHFWTAGLGYVEDAECLIAFEVGYLEVDVVSVVARY